MIGVMTLMVILIEQPDAKACGAAILDHMHLGDVLCMEDEAEAEPPSLAPKTSLIPRPRPIRK